LTNNSKLLGIVFFAYGFFELIYFPDLIGISSKLFLGFLLAAYGLVNVFVNIGHNKRAWLMFGNFLFFIGLFFILSDYYQIIEKHHMFFTLFLFVLGSGLLLLFIENHKERIFLYLSLFLFVISFFASSAIKILSGFSALANIGLALLAYCPIFLIFFGVAVLVNRKK
jgi:hypothetical protein